MAKIIKNIIVNWQWKGDRYSLKGFNIAITPLELSPKQSILCMEKMDTSDILDIYEYSFENVTLDLSKNYSVWVQAIYDGIDSEWVNQGGLVASDDGGATIVVKTDPAIVDVLNMASDSKLTRQEKVTLRKEWQQITNEYINIIKDADRAGVAINEENRALYVYRTNEVGKYLNGGFDYTVTEANKNNFPAWLSDNNLNRTESIDGEAYRKVFREYYEIKSRVLDVIKNASISAIKIGGENLLSKGGGKYLGVADWFSAGLKMQVIDNENWVRQETINGSANFCACRQLMIVKPNTEYTISVDVRASSNTLNTPIYAIFYKTEPANLTPFDYIEKVSFKGVYSGRVELTFKTKADAKYMRVGVDNDGKTSGDYSTVMFKDFKVEEGNKASMWKPSKEDIESDIRVVDEKVVDIISDSKFSPNEKSDIKREVDTIKAEKITFEALADLYPTETTTEKNNYITSYNTLINYIDPLLVNMTVSITIDSVVFRNNFKDYYLKRQLLINRVNSLAKDKTSTAQQKADTAFNNANSAQTSANNANSAINDMASDSKLTPIEKIQLDREFQDIIIEKDTNVSQAQSYGIATSAYLTAFNNLNTYLYGATGILKVLNTTSDITLAVIKAEYNKYFTARQALLDAIVVKAKEYADLNRVIYVKGTGYGGGNRVIKVENRIVVNNIRRGLYIYALNPITLEMVYSDNFDTYAGTDSIILSFVDKINELNNGNNIIIVASSDSAKLNDERICNALYKIGAGLPSKDIDAYREAYALIGKSKLGKGNGIERYVPKSTDTINSVEISVRLGENGTSQGTGDGSSIHYDSLYKRVQEAESKITKDAITNTVSETFYTKTETEQSFAQKSEVTQTKDSLTIAFSSKGGLNKVKNGNFKAGISQWLVWGSPTLNFGNYVASEADNAIRIDTTASNQGIQQVLSGLVAGKKYTVSARVYVTSGQPVFMFNKNEVYKSYTWDKALGYNKWNTVAYEHTAMGTDDLFLFGKSGGGEIGRYYITNIQISEGVVYDSNRILQAPPFTGHPSEIYEGNTKIDADGVEIYNGGLVIKNKAKEDVLKGDAVGNLQFSGTLISKSRGADAIKIDESKVMFYDWESGLGQPPQVGMIFSARHGGDINKKGFGLGNEFGAYSVVTYKDIDNRYGYVYFDRDNVTGYAKPVFNGGKDMTSVIFSQHVGMMAGRSISFTDNTNKISGNNGYLHFFGSSGFGFWNGGTLGLHYTFANGLSLEGKFSSSKGLEYRLKWQVTNYHDKRVDYNIPADKVGSDMPLITMSTTLGNVNPTLQITGSSTFSTYNWNSGGNACDISVMVY